MKTLEDLLSSAWEEKYRGSNFFTMTDGEHDVLIGRYTGRVSVYPSKGERKDYRIYETRTRIQSDEYMALAAIHFWEEEKKRRTVENG